MTVVRLALLIGMLACKREQPNVHADPDEKKHVRDDGIVIHRVVPRVGQKSHATMAQKTEVSITGLPTSIPASSVTIALDEERTEEVLAVDGRVITKMRVTYDSHVTSSTIVAGPTRTPSPVAGHTYVLEANAAGPIVLDAAGKPPPPTESAQVKRDYESFGKEDELFAALPDTPLHRGDVVPSLSEAIKNKLRGKSALDSKGDLKVRVERADRDEVTFTVSGTITFVTGTIDMEVPINGELVVRTADGWLKSYDLAGPLTMSTGDAGLSGKGQLSFSGKRTY